jgi:heme exporter protein A
MKESLVSIQNLSIYIGLKPIFKNISFQLFRREAVILSGENGTGKSTLLKSIFQSGEKKEFLWSAKQKEVRLSYLGHEVGLYSSLSLMDNLNYFSGILNHPINKDNLNKLIKNFGLEKKLYDPIHTFSEGMKRKSGILRALLVDPELLLLDEPFNGLDVRSLEIFLDEIREIKKNTTILIVSHDVDRLLKIIDRHLSLENSKISEKNV